MHMKFWLEHLKGRHHLENLGRDWRIILKWILGNVCVNWTELAQDRNQ